MIVSEMIKKLLECPQNAEVLLICDYPVFKKIERCDINVKKDLSTITIS